MKLLFVDTETGGTDEKKHSLLSVGLIYWENGKKIDSLELYIREKEYTVTTEALKINNLNLKEVYDKGISVFEAVSEINRFIEKNFDNEKAILCGHNVNFDIRFLKELYMKAGKNYEEKISYRSLDTASIFRFLTIAGKFKEQEINSLDDAIKYFEISVENRHTALGDIEKTVEIFNKVLKII